jgi:hypothetical protein
MLEPWQVLSLPSVTDKRGTLIPINLGIPLERVFILEILPEQSRGDHAFREGTQLIMPIRGSVNVSLHDGSNWSHFDLNKSTSALKISPHVWRRITAGSDGAAVLVIDSYPFNENNFIRDFPQFLALHEEGLSSLKNAPCAKIFKEAEQS